MPIRVLHIVSYMQRRGLETLLMNCFRHINRDAVQFDFMVHRSFRADYDDEIESLGGRIYRMPRLNPFSPVYKKALREFFQEHPEYRIVHCHLDCMSAIPLSIAKEYGVPVRIAHAHSSNQDRDWKYFLKRYYQKKIPDVATHFFACSEEAGKWMFPNQDVRIIKNGIETEKFSYSPEVRNRVRSELGLNNCLTLGHVGRFIPVKNHEFLIDIFHVVCKGIPDAKLLLIGNGPLEDAIRTKVKSMGLEHNVLFLGLRDDIHNILQAMDVFVLPSLYEGLSLSSVEAQVAGLYCLFSSNVSTACKMTDSVKFIPLNDKGAWSDAVVSMPLIARKSGKPAIIEAGFDIQTTAEFLQNFYIDLW